VSSSNRAAELRALADNLDRIGELEETAAQAKAAYRDDPTSEEAKAAHQEAAAALNSARAEARGSRVMVASTEPGSVAVSVSTVAAGAGKKG
jgi:siroheme synthase (precorrin-2 oxidase/ferrochelatase)